MTIWDDAPKGSKETFEFIKERAKYMRTVSYEELGAAVGLPPIGTNRPLGFIRDAICRPRGLPWLNALAVGKGTHVPGESFLPEGVSEEGTKNELLWWRGMVLQVYAYPWETLNVGGVQFPEGAPS